MIKVIIGDPLRAEFVPADKTEGPSQEEVVLCSPWTVVAERPMTFVGGFSVLLAGCSCTHVLLIQFREYVM